MDKSKHYDKEHEKYSGVFIKESCGFILSPADDFDAEALLNSIQNGIPLLKVISSSPRLIKGDDFGSKFHFKLAKGLKIKFATEEYINLVREIKIDTCSLLALQVKRGRSFSVLPSRTMTADDLRSMFSEPIIVSLAAPNLSPLNESAFWHANPSFRISAPKDWLIERPGFKRAA